MINFKTPVAYELADLLYAKIVEKGMLDLTYDHDAWKIFDSKPEYGLRRVSSGAIIILREKEDLEELPDRNGYKGFVFVYKG